MLPRDTDKVAERGKGRQTERGREQRLRQIDSRKRQRQRESRKRQRGMERDRKTQA